MGAPGSPGENGPPGAGQKIPHLVVAATNEDLGPLIGPNTTFFPKADGEVVWTSKGTLDPVFFDQPKCAGNAYVQGPTVPHASARPRAPWSTLLKYTGSLIGFPAPSYKHIINGVPQCDELDIVQRGGYLLVDTKIAAPEYSEQELAVQLL